MNSVFRALFRFAIAFGAFAAPSVSFAREPAETLTVDGTAFVVDAANGMGGFVDAATAVVAREWSHVAESAGVQPGATIAIHIEREFDDYFEREQIPSRPPEWAAGLALPSRRVILLAPGNPTWESTLVHEMSHVAVAIAANDGDLPAWFQEGFAVAVAEQWGIERATTMMRAGVTGAFHDFRDLERGFPGAQSMADLAYAQSFHFVHRMQLRFGGDVFVRTLAEMRGGKSFSEGFAASTGVLLSVAYDDWARTARTRYRWMPMFAGGGAAWGVVVVIGALAWRRRRRRQRERLASMEAMERGVWSRDPDDRTFG
jgi:hypothetical protein